MMLLAGMSASLFLMRFLIFARDWNGVEALKSLALCTLGFAPMYVAGYGWLAIACIIGERFLDEVLAYSRLLRQNLNAKMQRDQQARAQQMRVLEGMIEKRQAPPKDPAKDKADE